MNEIRGLPLIQIFSPEGKLLGFWCKPYIRDRLVKFAVREPLEPPNYPTNKSPGLYEMTVKFVHMQVVFYRIDNLNHSFREVIALETIGGELPEEFWEIRDMVKFTGWR